MQRLVRGSIAAILLVAAAGCAEIGDDGVAGPVPPDDRITVDPEHQQPVARASIGPQGGALDTDFGVTVVVPAGAVDQRLDFVAKIDAGGALHLEPVGVIFAEAVQVAIEQDDGDLIVLARCFGNDLTCAADPGEGASGAYDRDWVGEPGDLLAPGAVVPSFDPISLPLE